MEKHNVKEKKEVEGGTTNAHHAPKCFECGSQQVRKQSLRLYNLLFLNFRISGCVCTVNMLVVVVRVY
jgi:hypothetical protein